MIAVAAVATLGTTAVAQPGLTPEQVIEWKIALAPPGSIVNIAPGRYGTVRVLNVRPAAPVEVRLTGVTLKGLYIRNSARLNFVGGTLDPQDKSLVALDALNVERMTFRQMTATRALRGFTVGRSRDVQLLDNTAYNLRSDGFNVAAVQRVVVSGNSCRDFTPIKAIRDESGKIIKDGDHPDCIQSWSRPHELANIDIVVKNNRAEGDMQGIFFGNQPGDGGYDRIQIIDNVVNVGAPNGIWLGSGRDSRVSGNRVSSMPGYAFPNGTPVRTSIIIENPVRTVVCGNTVEDFPNSSPTRRCNGGGNSNSNGNGNNAGGSNSNSSNPRRSNSG